MSARRQGPAGASALAARARTPEPVKGPQVDLQHRTEAFASMLTETAQRVPEGRDRGETADGGAGPADGGDRPTPVRPFTIPPEGMRGSVERSPPKPPVSPARRTLDSRHTNTPPIILVAPALDPAAAPDRAAARVAAAPQLAAVAAPSADEPVVAAAAPNVPAEDLAAPRPRGRAIASVLAAMRRAPRWALAGVALTAAAAVVVAAVLVFRAAPPAAVAVVAAASEPAASLPNEAPPPVPIVPPPAATAPPPTTIAHAGATDRPSKRETRARAKAAAKAAAKARKAIRAAKARERRGAARAAAAKRHSRKQVALASVEPVAAAPATAPSPAVPSAKPAASPAPTIAGDDGNERIERARDSYRRGNELLFKGDAAAAASAYENAIRLNSQDPAGYRGLGLAYAAQGKHAQAIRYLRAYLKRAPGGDDRSLISDRIALLKSK